MHPGAHALRKLTVSEARLLSREPLAVFFTLAFPLIVLVVFGSIFGNDPTSRMGGRGSVDVSTPAYVAMIIATTAMLGLPQVLATYRDQGILRRLRATPIPAGTVIAAQLLVSFAITALGVGVLIAAGVLLYHLRLPSTPAALALAFGFGCLSLFMAGVALAAVLPTARVAQAVGIALFYPMLFLSGAAMPRQLMPESVQRVAEILPVTQLVILLDDLWTGAGWNMVAVVYLSGLLIFGAIVALRTFRWE